MTIGSGSAEIDNPNPTDSTPLVACLCAQWCGTCRDYQDRFASVHHQFPGVQWMWVDIEAMAHVVEPLDLDDFPTLFVGQGNRVTFFGPLTPQRETLVRLLQVKLGADAPSIEDPQAHALLLRLRAAKDSPA